MSIGSIMLSIRITTLRKEEAEPEASRRIKKLKIANCKLRIANFTLGGSG